MNEIAILAKALGLAVEAVADALTKHRLELRTLPTPDASGPMRRERMRLVGDSDPPPKADP